jgi:kynureninase
LGGIGADFATGCGYKYVCGGPGSPAFAFVAERHLADLRQPLTGWFGHARPFAFSDEYEAAPGIEKLQCGTSPILGLAALEVGVELIAEIGVGRLHEKSQALSEFFLECLADRSIDLDLVSPRDPRRRGSQLSFRHPEAYAICQALIARGVIGDFRAPDILRLGFAPAYLRFEDVAEAARHLAEVLESDEWQREEFSRRAAVT